MCRLEWPSTQVDGRRDFSPSYSERFERRRSRQSLYVPRLYGVSLERLKKVLLTDHEEDNTLRVTNTIDQVVYEGLGGGEQHTFLKPLIF